MFAQTVEENKLFYAPREVDRAKQACDLLAALGSPSIADLKAAVAVNAIANLPVVGMNRHGFQVGMLGCH